MTKPSSGEAEGNAAASAAESLRSIDFSTFVLSLGTSALYQMGKVPGPEGGPAVEPDLLLAKHTIDTLKMLRAKTEGNLDPEESKLLDSLLYDLHMHFVELQKSQSS